jgi:malate dehydrogenase (oxaloacetate-decarboxylating)
MAGVNSLASLSPALSNPEASLLPDLADVREISVVVAAAVVRQAVADNNAQDKDTVAIVQGKGPLSLEEHIKVGDCSRRRRTEADDDGQSRMWDAVYRPLELVD